MTTKRKKYLFVIIICMFLFNHNVEAKEYEIEYSSHVQSYGWMEKVGDGKLSGTEGKGKRLEAIRINIPSNNTDNNIEYKSYIENYGWEESWKMNGEISGTQGEAKRLEAIKIKITGELENQYDVYYRVHTQTFGWLDWAKNGEIAGTLGYLKRIEAIEIKLVEKGLGNETSNSFRIADEALSYTSHMQTYGWLDEVSSGIAGITGQGKRMEAFKVNYFSKDYSGYLQYTSFVEGIGWEKKWRYNGEISGTVGYAKKIERIKMILVGEVAEYYDVYYRVHVQGFGWLGWAKNGESAGTEGLNFRVESFEMKILPKTTPEETGDFLRVKDANLTYGAHVRKIGNQKETTEGHVMGTTGQGLRMEGFYINLYTEIPGNILYKTNIANDGWEENFKKGGEYSGTQGQSKGIHSIQIKLDGEIASKYDVYYRTHISYFGWLDWAKNGEIAGNNKYEIEAIEVKLFLKIDSNKNSLLTNNYYMDIKQYNPVYYQQKDSRWADKIYGGKKMSKTGCTPTSLAMAYTSILNRVILPTEVADYLYYNTNEFNKKTSGSSGMAIIYASQYYGIKYKALHSQEEIKKALLRGTIVYGAMGNGKFATTTWNHAIIMFQYNQGNTYVYDPLKEYNNGWISINQLWNEQSIDPDDYSGGGIFYSLELFK